MDFNAPLGPQDMVFPETAHVWADAVITAVAIGLLVYALVEWRRIGFRVSRWSAPRATAMTR